MRLVVNEDNCSGCRVCELVCALENFRENNPRLARLRIHGEFPAPGKYQITYCDQCGACADACPVEAIRKQDDGHFRLFEDECTGCLTCVEVCPRGAVFTHVSREIPFKCTNCGLCVEYCPRNAIYDGDDPAKTTFKEFEEVK